MRFLIVIPTLNEKKNVTKLARKILNLYPSANILFIDDNSNDGTQDELINLSKNRKIKYIFRAKKLGIGSAHKLGIFWAFKKKYDYVITMDCDGTHDPKYIQQMFNEIKKFNLVNTSRFNSNNSMQKWSLVRVMITSIRHFLVKHLLNLKFDSSGGFRMYDLKKIKSKHIALAKHNGYSFLWESLFILNLYNYKIKDINVVLPVRKLGSSKMRFLDILDGFIYLIIIFIKFKIL